MTDDDLETLDVVGAAAYLKMSKDTVRRKVRSGAIPGAKIGKHWIFIKEDLKEAIRQNYMPQYLIQKEKTSITLGSVSAAKKLEKLLALPARKKREFTLFDARLEEKKLEERLGLQAKKKPKNTSKS